MDLVTWLGGEHGHGHANVLVAATSVEDEHACPTEDWLRRSTS